jgi:hypothetical protein
VGTPFYHEEIPLWIFLLQLSNFILQLTHRFPPLCDTVIVTLGQADVKR